jgi:hypothetical protein
MKMQRILSLTVLAALLASPVLAQTALNSTTLSAAVTATTNTFTVASGSNISANDLAFVDREAVVITAISGTTLTVNRGQAGTAAASHANAALIYTGVPERYYGNTPSGSCTRANELYLPHINLKTGDVSDCPTGTGTWALMNVQGLQTAKSTWMNLDNGAGTTIDDVLVRFPRPIRIVACRAVYVDVTSGTVAAGTFSVGTTVGGVDIVAATAYENAKAVGTSTAGVIVAGAVAANTAVFVRHTGVAATAVGQAYIECDYQIQ